METREGWPASAARDRVREMDVDAVIWDFDGVLCDSEPRHARSYRTLLTAWGNDVPDDFFAPCLGHSEAEIWAMLAGRFDIPVVATEATRLRRASLPAHFAGAEPTWLARDLVAHFAERRVEQMVVSAGVGPLLVALVERWGWAEVLPVRASEGGKLAVLGECWRRRCLTIEDNRRYLAAARAAGSATLGVRHAMNDVDDACADVVVCL